MSEDPSKKIQVWRIKNSQISPNTTEDVVIAEKPLTVVVPAIGSFTLLCTPVDLKELAVGFIYSEGIVASRDDIVDIDCTQIENMLIAIKVKNADNIQNKRNLIVTSGCGMCGKHNLDHLLLTIPPCPNTLKITPPKFVPLSKKILSQQTLFLQTGATHTAAIFDQNQNIIVMKEDLARHNALDKAIGHCLLNRINLSARGVFLSSRVSFEMVAKAARAGFEIILAVSAPSALAIKAAEFWHLTLGAFLRDDSGNIYTGIERCLD